MKAEIELSDGGHCVELEFSYHYETAEQWHKVPETWEFYPDFITRIDDHGKPMLPENAANLDITPFIENQLISEVTRSWE